MICVSLEREYWNDIDSAVVGKLKCTADQNIFDFPNDPRSFTDLLSLLVTIEFTILSIATAVA